MTFVVARSGSCLRCLLMLFAVLVSCARLYWLRPLVVPCVCFFLVLLLLGIVWLLLFSCSFGLVLLLLGIVWLLFSCSFGLVIASWNSWDSMLSVFDPLDP